jgi:hypothetical protein
MRPAAAAKKSPVQRQISSEEIGHVAGEVWDILHNNGDQTLVALKKSVHAPADLVVAAIGWLAREGKLNFANDGRSVKVSLR